MANIFSGTDLPAWLQERNKANAEHGQWGQVAGTLAGGLLNSFRRDEEAPVDPETGKQPRQGFMKGLYEARMNQQDPMWKLKTQKAKVDMLQTVAQMEATHALGQEREQEMKAWMADAPALSPWLAATPEKRAVMPIPTARSQRGMQMVGQVSMADERYKIQSENSKARLAKEALGTEFESAKLEMDPATTGVAYDDLVRKGRAYAVNPDGSFSNFPSQEAINLLNQERTSPTVAKLPIGASEAMRKDYEQRKRIQSQAANIASKTEGQLKVAERKGEIAGKLLDQKYDNMEDFEALRQTDRVALAKAKSEFADDLMTHRLEIVNGQRDKENSIYFQEPKEYVQKDGSVVITWGKDMRLVPPGKAGADERLKSDLKLSDYKIKKLQDKAIVMPKDATVLGQLLDAQLERIRLFDRKSRKPTAQEIKAMDNPPPSVSTSSTNATQKIGRFSVTPLSQ